MIRKTQAVVLFTQKFRETSLLTTLYTQEYGVQKFIVKGYRSTKGKKRHSYFQPLSIIDIVFYYRETRDLQLITESSLNYFMHTLQTDPVKITLGLLLIEIFYRSVREEERNDSLFNFLREILISLD